MFSGEELVKSHRARANALINIIVMSAFCIIARLWYLQIFKGPMLLNYSLQNQLRREDVKAPRGIIYGRNDEVLVENIPRFDVVITPQYLKDKEDTLARLAVILNMPKDSISAILKKNMQSARYKTVVIKKNVDRETVAIIETENNDLPGVSIEPFIGREYVDHEMGAHVYGYISEISKGQLPRYSKNVSIEYKLGDFVGQFGLEERWDKTLRGINGNEFVEVDALGRKKRDINAAIIKNIRTLEVIPGNNLRLTIDRDLQLEAYKAMHSENKNGAVVVVNVKNGEILAMVSTPSFDPGLFARGIMENDWNLLSNDVDHPLRDRAIQEHYPPASTFKTIVAWAALEEGIINEHTEVHCSGTYQLGKRTFHCWKKHGHGSGVDVYRALRESCDIFFYKIAKKMDIDVLAKYAHKLGMGSKTGIDLPREVTGLIPTKAWKKKRFGQEWAMGETLSCVIGQSFVLASPLQMAMAYAAFANGGKVFRPMIVKDVLDFEGKVIKHFKSEQISSFTMTPKFREIIDEGLYQVVNNPRGTVFSKRRPGLLMSGKTGTGQVIRLSAEKLFTKCHEAPYHQRHHGVFVGFGPSGPIAKNDVDIAIAVVVEHGCSGSTAASPIAISIMEKYMLKYRYNDYLRFKKEEQAVKQ